MPEPTLRLDADLSFRCSSSDGSAGVSGTIRASGTTIEVAVSGPVTTVGKPSRVLVRQLAKALARRRLRLVVRAPAGVIVALGDVHAPWWQRLATRSPDVRLGRLREVRKFLGGAGPSGRAVAVSVPPLTVLPLFPTVSTLGPRPVTTTHDPRGGGRPRVIFASTPWPQAGDVRRVAYLKRPRTTFGSRSDCDVRINGLEPLHAVIDRTDDDEYVLTHVAPAGTSTVAGHFAQGSLLRTGSRITMGEVRLNYFREEYADHGRPYGGRLGGEIGHQRPQRKPRPRTQGAVGRPRTNRDPGQYYP